MPCKRNHINSHPYLFHIGLLSERRNLIGRTNTINFGIKQRKESEKETKTTHFVGLRKQNDGTCEGKNYLGGRFLAYLTFAGLVVKQK